MRNSTFSALCFFAFSAITQGCFFAPPDRDEPKESNTTEGVATQDLLGYFSAQSGGQTLRVYARIGRAGEASDFLRTGAGDQMVAEIDGVRVPLTLQASGIEQRYVASVAAPASQANVKIMLERSTGTSALGSTAIVPAPFQLEGPAELPVGGFELSTDLKDLGTTTSAFGVSVTSKGSLPVEVEGACVANGRETLYAKLQDGKLKVPGVTLAAGTSSCDALVRLKLTTKGSLDPAFARSSSFLDEAEFVAEQTRIVRGTLRT
jgi:hypothetical protein